MKMARYTCALVGAVTGLLVVGAGALAQQTPGNAKAPTTATTKPNLGKGPSEQTSVPSKAAPATTTARTGEGNQDTTVKAMNNNAKAKVEAEGK